MATGERTTLALTTEEANPGDRHGPTLADDWVELEGRTLDETPCRLRAMTILNEPRGGA